MVYCLVLNTHCIGLHTYNLAYFGTNQLTEYYVLKSASIIMSQQLIACPVCQTDSGSLSWDARYNGYRGTCVLCGCDWPES